MSDYLKTATILYVEDNEEVRQGYTKTLKRMAKELFVAADGEEGLALFKKHTPDIVISDIRMPKLDGIEMARCIREIQPSQIVIFTTAYHEPECTLPALELQINGYLLKPINKKKLETKINQLSKHLVLEKEIQEQRFLLKQILNHQSNITLVSDFTSITFASSSFWSMLSLKNEREFFARYPTFFDLISEHDDYICGKTAEDFLERYCHSDSDMRLVSITTLLGPTSFYINLDKVRHIDKELYIITLTDVTSLQASRLDAQHHASFDRLTKICNRHTFEGHLERELCRIKRYHRPLCMALIDIDYFKKFNDTFGHLIGDEILIMIAKEINLMVRNSDLFARWGGEEFALLMSETSLCNARTVVEHIRHKVEQIMHPIAGNVTVSIGLTKIIPFDTYKAVFERCDQALYQAKSIGRNTIVEL